MATILISILMLALGGYMVFSQLQKDRRCSQPATATVVGRETKRVRSGKGRRSTHYAPVLEFEADGQTVPQAAQDHAAQIRSCHGLSSGMG